MTIKEVFPLSLGLVFANSEAEINYQAEVSAYRFLYDTRLSKLCLDTLSLGLIIEDKRSVNN